jgi:hypothetical protein
MEIKCIAGSSVIAKQPAASASLYQEALGLPLETFGEHSDYLFVDKFPGSNHFGVWPLRMAAQSCFGQDEWPAGVPGAESEGPGLHSWGKDRALGASLRKVHEPRRSAGRLELCAVAT